MTIFDTPATPAPDPAPAAGTSDTGAPPASDPGVAAPEPAGVPADLPTGDIGPGVETPPAPQYLEVDQYGDFLVKAKVDGEVKEIPFKDAVNGVMMQEAFTRRTQELAAERRRLQQADALVAALESDPATTIRELSEVYDLDPDAGLAPIERDPQEQQLRDMQMQLAQQQQLFQQQQIQNEISTLRSQYGDFDLQGTAKYAHENGLTLTAAYKAMQFDSLRERQAQEAEQEKRRQAALQAQGAVHDQASTQRGSVGSGAKPVSNLRDAWMAAKAAKS